MNRVQSTLHTAKLPFAKYWAFCLLNTVIRGNSLVHDTIGDIPRRIWERLRVGEIPFPTSSINKAPFRIFGEYGHCAEQAEQTRRPWFGGHKSVVSRTGEVGLANGSI